MAKVTIVKPHKLSLSPKYGVRDLKVIDFPVIPLDTICLEDYDQDTIFCDIFLAKNKGVLTLIFLGPPLLNLKSAVFPFKAQCNGVELEIYEQMNDDYQLLLVAKVPCGIDNNVCIEGCEVNVKLACGLEKTYFIEGLIDSNKQEKPNIGLVLYRKIIIQIGLKIGSIIILLWALMRFFCMIMVVSALMSYIKFAVMLVNES